MLGTFCGMFNLHVVWIWAWPVPVVSWIAAIRLRAQQWRKSVRKERAAQLNVHPRAMQTLLSSGRAAVYNWHMIGGSQTFSCWNQGQHLCMAKYGSCHMAYGNCHTLWHMVAVYGSCHTHSMATKIGKCMIKIQMCTEFPV